MLSCCKQTSGFFSDKRVSLWRVYEVMCFFCKSSSRVWMCRDLWLNINSEQPPKFRKNTSFLLYSQWPMLDTLLNIQYFWTWVGFFFSDTGVFVLICVVNWLSEKPQMKIILAHWGLINHWIDWLFFFCYQQFLFFIFSHKHNRISKIKQNKTADTYSTSQGSIKREGREGRTTRTQKSLL